MGHIEIAESTWNSCLGERPFQFRHNLQNHDLLTHEAVARLAGQLPRDLIEVDMARRGAVWDSEERGTCQDDAEQAAREVSTRGIRLVAHEVQRVPQYRELVDACVVDATGGVVRNESVMGTEGYVFLSDTHSRTPAHVDHEHNIFCQIEGAKAVTVGGFPDSTTQQQVMEGMFSGSYGRTAHPPIDGQRFLLGPGDGVYIPPAGVHMVETFHDLSISFSLVFLTRSVIRASRVHTFNARLRKLGIDPRPPAERLVVDTAKATAVDLWRRTKGSVSR